MLVNSIGERVMKPFSSSSIDYVICLYEYISILTCGLIVPINSPKTNQEGQKLDLVLWVIITMGNNP